MKGLGRRGLHNARTQLAVATHIPVLVMWQTSGLGIFHHRTLW